MESQRSPTRAWPPAQRARWFPGRSRVTPGDPVLPRPGVGAGTQDRPRHRLPGVRELKRAEGRGLPTSRAAPPPPGGASQRPAVPTATEQRGNPAGSCSGQGAQWAAGLTTPEGGQVGAQRGWARAWGGDQRVGVGVREMAPER